MFVANDQQGWPHTRFAHFDGTTTARRIAFVLTDSCDLLGVCAIAEALDCACALATGEAPVRYEMQFLSASGGCVKCDGSLIVATEALASTRDMRFSSVLVAGGPLSQEMRNRLPHASWLQRMRANGTPVRFLAAVHEKSRVEAASWSPDGTGAGAGHGQPLRHMARLAYAIKAAFDVICADFGESIAREALRRTAYMDSNVLLGSSIDRTVTSADRVRAAARWLRENCNCPFCIAGAADASAMSQRTLLRYFRTYLGTSPSRYLRRARLELACELLAQTSMPVDDVARRVGLGSGDRLGKLFRRCIGRSPTEYRAWRRSQPDSEAPGSRYSSATRSRSPGEPYDGMP
ncbi:helix-turn-helix domain-containing protein [Paraburkholderia sp. SIMBA_054]|uniref:helix-turn-helix domain-containing protein n=1 Tax=Paraburkholderia sp. SIMBA_054 TaxID=3085795 RepID=UPI00397946BE